MCCELESYVSDINTTADISIECTQSVPNTDIGVDEYYTDTTGTKDSNKQVGQITRTRHRRRHGF
jgi:hypothetical protein